MLRDEDKKEISKRLADMKDPVKMVLFTQKLDSNCQYCNETETLLNEVAELSDKLELQVLNFVSDKEAKEKYNVDKIPALIVQNEVDYGIRFYGIPSGYEFATLLEVILSVSAKDSGFSEEAKNKIKTINKPVHIQVFVTPTCPYCPSAAFMGYKLAQENENITADTVEVSEFPDLGQKYSVMGVPKIVINEDHSFEGALPEDMYIEKVLEAVT